LKQALGIDSELVRSSGGVFEVQYGGDTIFSKRKLGRFPNDGEVQELMKGK
jgi:selenoprotein W-related protein